MVHKWSKNLEAQNVQRQCLYYKGLKFPKYHGDLPSADVRSGEEFFAYFGGTPLSERAIRYRVDLMIERGNIGDLDDYQWCHELRYQQEIH